MQRLALFIQSNLSSQPCLPDGIYFSDQAAIDDFQTNYPNCREIKNIYFSYART